MNPHFETFRGKISSPISFRFFLLQKLPTAYLCGLRIKELNANTTVISVRHGWFNQNPFRSMYFAVQSMAAEMSTGLMSFGQVYRRNPAVSMLVVKLEASFIKKATGLILFTCTDGALIDKAVEDTIASGESTQIVTRSVGTNENNEVVAEFLITWSFKARKNL
jgi:hypothetical protein